MKAGENLNWQKGLERTMEGWISILVLAALVQRPGLAAVLICIWLYWIFKRRN
jgi:hypothetical protein